MVRPCASKENRLLCLEFVKACTKVTGDATDLLARCGPLSPFAALSRCCPTAVRVEGAGRRDGITELECNKVLQTSGFQMIRDRRASAKNKSEDPFGSGLYLYTEVQWRDPDNSDDMLHLSQSWESMCHQFQLFAAECTLQDFVSAVRDMLSTWKPHQTRKDIRARSHKRKLEHSDSCSSMASMMSCMKRQESEMSMASTIADEDFSDFDLSPETKTFSRSQSFSWTDQNKVLEADHPFPPAKRQCYFLESHNTVLEPAMNVPVPGWQPSAEVMPTAEVQYWDCAAVWPQLPEEDRVDDAVVMSLLQRV